jgi:hypothetical protein
MRGINDPKKVRDTVTVLYEVPGNPYERNWIDGFGEHFEYRYQMPSGLIYSRKITRTAYGWSPSWDDVRKTVMDAAALGTVTSITPGVGAGS